MSDGIDRFAEYENYKYRIVPALEAENDRLKDRLEAVERELKEWSEDYERREQEVNHRGAVELRLYAASRSLFASAPGKIEIDKGMGKIVKINPKACTVCGNGPSRHFAGATTGACQSYCAPKPEPAPALKPLCANCPEPEAPVYNLVNTNSPSGTGEYVNTSKPEATAGKVCVECGGRGFIDDEEGETRECLVCRPADRKE